MQRAAVLLALLLCTVGGAAIAQSNPAVGPQAMPTLTAQPRAPVIKMLDTGACVQPGTQLVVMGANFEPRGTRQAVLADANLHIDLRAMRWTATTLLLDIPVDKRIAPGQRYFIGIEAQAHGPWLSNTDRTLLICGDARREPPAADDTLPPDEVPPPGVPGDDGGEPAAPAAPPAGGNPFGSGTTASPGNYRPAALLQSQADGNDAADAEPGELVAWHEDLAAAQAFASQAQSLGFTLRRRQVLQGLGITQTTLGVPPGMSLADAQNRLRALSPELLIDANHRYSMLGDAPADQALQLVGWSPAAPACGTSGKVGIVDTGIEATHAALAGMDVTVESVLPAGIESAPAAHGTAVATRIAGLVPGAGLRVAAVFRQRDGDVVDTTVEWLVLALDWLLRERVAVVNLSLGGPDNRLLAAAVQRVIGSGSGVVAAVGDGGPESQAVFPSAWPGVVGVTAVDAAQRVFRSARQGDEVDIAAPGVDVVTTRADGSAAYLTGTSYATPFVAAAWLLAGSNDALASHVEDLGKTGRDAMFGAGLVRFDRLCGGERP